MEKKLATDPKGIGYGIRQFSENLLALREFVDLIGPVLTQRSQEQVRENAKGLIPLIIAAQKLGVGEPLTVDREQKLREQFGSEIRLSPAPPKENGSEGLAIHVAGSGHDEFEAALRVLRRQNYHEELLYGNALVSLVSAAESFLARLLHLYFYRQPGTLGLKEKVFSLEDLQRFGSVEDAKSHLIDSRVEDVLRASLEDWITFFKTRVGLSMGYFEPHKDRLVEVAQRRNILVHNGGILNSIYMSRVSPELASRHKVGGRIYVSRNYLEEAISLVEQNFVLVGAELWKKLAPSDEGRADVLIDLAVEHLRAERWRVAEGFSYFTHADKGLSERTTLVGTVNYWLSLKSQKRFEDIRSEIEAADFSAKDEVFQLARATLLDQSEEVFRLLPEVLDTEKLSLEDLRTWPLFRALRDADRYAEFAAERGYVEPASSPAIGDENLSAEREET